LLGQGDSGREQKRRRHEDDGNAPNRHNPSLQKNQ
jgi:hypothetical protein